MVGHLASSSRLTDCGVLPPVCAGLPQDVRPTSACGLQSKRRVHVTLRLVCMLVQVQRFFFFCFFFEHIASQVILKKSHTWYVQSEIQTFTCKN